MPRPPTVQAESVAHPLFTDLRGQSRPTQLHGLVLPLWPSQEGASTVGEVAEFPKCWARSRRHSRSLSSIRSARVTRLLNEEGCRPGRGGPSSPPIGPTLISAPNGVVVSPAVGHQGAELQGVFRYALGPLLDAVQPPGCISPVRGVVKHSLEFLRKLLEVGGQLLWPSPGPGRESEEIIRATLAPSDRNLEGWCRKRRWHCPRKPRHLSNSPE